MADISPEKMCLRKIPYTTRGKAEKRIAKKVEKGYVQPGELEAYACWYCGFHHIGHPNRSFDYDEALRLLVQNQVADER